MRRNLTPYGFIAPNVALFTAFSFAPLIYAFYISFFDWSIIGDADYIGIHNYARLLRDPQFWHALRNTIVYAATTVPTSMAIGLALAIALNRYLPLRTLFRSIYFMPVVVSAVATGTIAAWMFNDNYGVLNAILVRIGVGRIAWLSTPQWSLPSLAIATLWVRLGFNMVVYLAALQSIPAMYGHQLERPALAVIARNVAGDRPGTCRITKYGAPRSAASDSMSSTSGTGAPGWRASARIIAPGARRPASRRAGARWARPEGPVASWRRASAASDRGRTRGRTRSRSNSPPSACPAHSRSAPGPRGAARARPPDGAP